MLASFSLTKECDNENNLYSLSTEIKYIVINDSPPPRYQRIPLW